VKIEKSFTKRGSMELRATSERQRSVNGANEFQVSLHKKIANLKQIRKDFSRWSDRFSTRWNEIANHADFSLTLYMIVTKETHRRVFVDQIELGVELVLSPQLQSSPFVN
jgi:hypothetical protein